MNRQHKYLSSWYHSEMKNSFIPSAVAECKRCGKPLSGRRQFIFCSGNCARQHHNERRAKLAPIACVECGESFQPDKSDRKFCGRSCAMTHNNKGVDRHAKSRPKPKDSGNECLVCKKITSNKKYCGYDCSATARSFHADKEMRKKAKRRRQREGWYRYHARRLGQTPHDVDVKELQRIYFECPDGYEVDHRIPISKGGLHHPDNLQYLPKLENRRKGNKLPHELAPRESVELSSPGLEAGALPLS